MRVFVKNLRNQSLMPCTQRKARLLLKESKAKIINYSPFIIQLLIATGETVQDVKMGVDSGAKFIGIAIVSNNKVLIKGTIELRSDIKELLENRKILRRSRRNRKTRYRRCKFKSKTNRKWNEKKQKYVKYKISFTSSRDKGWLPPSVQSRIDNEINWINKFKSLLPNPKVIIEVGKFDAHKMINPEIEGVEYQKGDLYDYENIKAYLIARENNRCQICKKEYDGNGWHTHHIKQRKDGGSNRAENLALVHSNCHENYHLGKLPNFKFKKSKGYKETTFMNILRQQIFQKLDCKITYGNITKVDRQNLKLEKTHYNDAIAVSETNKIKENDNTLFYIKQFRKKKRSLHESIARKGKSIKGIKNPNITAKRNNKNTKYSNGFYLNDKVNIFGEKGWISGFCSGACYVKDIDNKYITIPNKSYKQVGFKHLELIHHNNNWQYSNIGDSSHD